MAALGGASGGVALYMDKGQLVYEYNMLIIERTTARGATKITPGKHKIEVDELIAKREQQTAEAARATQAEQARR